MQVLYQLSYGPMSTWWLQNRRRLAEAYTAGASDLPPHGNQATLHLHLFGGKLNRLISGVGSFQHHRRPLAMEMLERCLLYTSPSPRDSRVSRMPSSA